MRHMEHVRQPPLALALLAALVSPGAVAAQAGPPDFNGDGLSDLAVGAPNENLETPATGDAGAVQVVYGTSIGLSGTNSQLWTQDSPGILDDAEAGDQFGTAVAFGDFNGDGFSDLAVGAPNEDVGTTPNAGVVNVLFGTSAGLTSLDNELLSQDSRRTPGVAEDGDRFGWSVAGGDFDGDGFDDLAVGVIGDRVKLQETPRDNAGSVNVFYGSATGLDVAKAQIWNEKVLADNPALDDLFGWALVAGDFDGDGFDELIIGGPFENTSQPNSGIVYRLIGTAGGLEAGDLGFQFYLQGHKGVPDIDCPFQPFPEGCQEPEDHWGYVVSAGDYDGDGFDDLAIGVPGEEYDDVVNAGQVHVLYGSDEGPVRSPSQLSNQDQPDVLEEGERGDGFGAALASADFDGDGFDDLAVGVPDEDLAYIAPAQNGGQVHLFLGGPTGAGSRGQQLWSQDSPNVLDQAEPGDKFGEFLGAGDYDGDGRVDLAVGVPEEDAGAIRDSGVVNVLYGAGSGLGAGRNQLWFQGAPGLADVSENGDRFGAGLPVR